MGIFLCQVKVGFPETLETSLNLPLCSPTIFRGLCLVHNFYILLINCLGPVGAHRKRCFMYTILTITIIIKFAFKNVKN